MIERDRNSIILFDGVCNLCNSSVQFVIKYDKHDRFRFASLQSEIANQLLKDHKIDSKARQSIILIEEGQVYIRSTAALRIARNLNKGWPLLYGLIIIPQPIRDGVYDWIAGNRYKWFGKQESCQLPEPSLKHKFL